MRRPSAPSDTPWVISAALVAYISITAMLAAPALASQRPHREAANPRAAIGTGYAGVSLRSLGRNAVRKSSPPGLQVLDVSVYQGKVGWAVVKAKGASFAYVKATEARNYTNPDFWRQYNGAHRAGLMRGAYHFARPDLSGGKSQADFFAAHGGGWTARSGTLPPALDLESGAPAHGECWGLDPAAMVAWVRAFSDEVYVNTGRYPAIYTGSYWWDDCTANDTEFGNTNPLWIANYSTMSSPALPSGWTSYAIWQFSDSGTFPGDQDVFNGNAAQLVELANGPSRAPVDVNDDGASDAVFLTGVNGTTTKSGHLQVHAAYGPTLNSRGGFTAPFGSVYNLGRDMPFFADTNGDGNADMCFLRGVNGGTTASGHLEVHCAYGPTYRARKDFRTPLGPAVNTQKAMPFFADANGDGDADLCVVRGVNGGTTVSGHVEVRCSYGPAFHTRGVFVTPISSVSTTQMALPFFADVNGDGTSDLCFLQGVNGGITVSGRLEVDCAPGPTFGKRKNFVTPFASLSSTQTALPFLADANGDGKADVCLALGVNGGTTKSGRLEVHCAYGPAFHKRSDFATQFGYLSSTQTALPFLADANADGRADLCFMNGVNGGKTSSGHAAVHCAYGPTFQARGDFVTPFAYLNQANNWIANRGTGSPMAPGRVAATAANASASVSFSPPVFDGGSPVMGYTVTASPGGATVTSGSSPLLVPGLTNGKSYTFTVTASNAFGPGPPSPPPPL